MRIEVNSVSNGRREANWAALRFFCELSALAPYCNKENTSHVGCGQNTTIQLSGSPNGVALFSKEGATTDSPPLNSSWCMRRPATEVMLISFDCKLGGTDTGPTPLSLPRFRQCTLCMPPCDSSPSVTGNKLGGWKECA